LAEQGSVPIDKSTRQENNAAELQPKLVMIADYRLPVVDSKTVIATASISPPRGSIENRQFPSSCQEA